MDTRTDIPPALERLLDTISADEHGIALSAAEEQVELGQREQAVRRIADGLYRKWHAGSRRPLGDSYAPRDLTDDDFMRPLARGLADRRTISPGWLVHDRTSAGVIIERDGLRVLAAPGDLSGDIRAGEHVTVAMPSARPTLSPGFFIIDGESGTPGSGPGWTMRVYAHLDGAHAHVGARRALAVLDAAGDPFRMKLLSSRVAYPRYDGLVIYLKETTGPKRLDEIADALAGCLAGEDVSPFVARLEAGIGFAWEPTERSWPPQSFGQHRARIIAEAIVDWAAGPEGPGASDLAAVVADHLTIAGVQSSAPWREFVSPPDPWDLAAVPGL